KTEVSWPAVPLCTTERPGTSRNASATRSICFSSKSCESTTLMLAGDCSSGVSMRVAVITIGSFTDEDDVCCARMTVTLHHASTKNSERCCTALSSCCEKQG